MSTTLDEVIDKVQQMANYFSEAKKLAKSHKLDIVNVTWEDNARYKNSVWGPCISDMTLQVNNRRMPVIRSPNYTDETWDVPIDKLALVVGNETFDKSDKLKTVSLAEYLKHFDCYMTKPPKNKNINLLRNNNKDSHVIMSSQACFLPIPKGEETKFNVALYNYQSRKRNPAVLTIVSTSKGSSAQIIEGNEVKLLFNNNGMKADFVGQRLTDNRIERNVSIEGEMTKEEKQDNIILIIQIPLKQKAQFNQFQSMGLKINSINSINSMNSINFYKSFNNNCKRKSRGGFLSKCSIPKPQTNVEAAIVKISNKLIPICCCKNELTKMKASLAYNNNNGVECDKCSKQCNSNDFVWHCNKNKLWPHFNGFDLCFNCGNEQLKFNELNDLDTIERDNRYPIRITLQYYKSTDNGIVNNDIMSAIANLLQSSKKQSDFIGSLVVEPNNGIRPTEWVKKDEYLEIKKILANLNLLQYLNIFKAHEVSDSVLILFESMDSLKELIPKLGQRMKIWNQIKNYQKKFKLNEQQNNSNNSNNNNNNNSSNNRKRQNFDSESRNSEPPIKRRKTNNNNSTNDSKNDETNVKTN